MSGSDSHAAAAPSGATSPIRRLDDAVFALETGVVALLLSAMTAMVFLDVIYRQLVAPESTISQVLTPFFPDRATRALVSPWIGAVLGYAVLYAGVRASERSRNAPLLPIKGSAAIVALGTGLALGLLGWMMVVTSSSVVYLTLTAVALGAFLYGQFRHREPGWQTRVIVAVVFGGLVAALALSPYFPNGYTWAKEIAMTTTLWVGFFGASLCVYAGKHIRLEALEKTHPEKAKPALAALSQLLAAAFCALMVYLGYHYVFAEGTGMLHVGGALEQTGLPDWIRVVAIPVLFGVSMLRFVGSAVSQFLGGTYGATAKAEGMEEAEAAAAARGETLAQTDGAPKKKPITFFVIFGLVVLLPFLGKGGILTAVILALALLAEPLFVVLGAVTILCFVLWSQNVHGLGSFSILIERIVSIADNQALLAIPFFIMSGAVMARGHISARLIGFAQSLVGWLPGGMAISAVLACMIFAAISGSSPATVVAIGGMMAPALIKQGYSPSFAHGLVTSAGSLGILIPPSIPMIVYCIVNTTTPIRVEELFAAGFGPGFVIGGILMGYSLYRGVVDKTPRQAFSVRGLGNATRDGIWSLMFPGLILGGIYLGIFNAIESACVSVVYAVVVEVYVHRALELKEIPKIFGETAIMLGSFLVILVVAMSFGEFLEDQAIPAGAADWIRSMNLDRVQFLLALNLLLLVVGCLMDIMSAIFIFVPLIAPMANAFGIDPLHLGIIFIVNLEIGYLTPPVGLNLFVASTLFNKPLTYLINAVLPFIGMMMIGLMVITYVPPISADFGRWIAGVPPREIAETTPEGDDEVGDEGGEGSTGPTGGCVPPPETPEDLNCDGNVSMEEMMEFSERGAAPEEAPPAPTPTPAPSGDPAAPTEEPLRELGE